MSDLYTGLNKANFKAAAFDLFLMCDWLACLSLSLPLSVEEFDWQMGVHSALVQETISVIVVQVGDGHTHTQSRNLTHTQLRTRTQSDNLTHLDTHTQSQKLTHTHWQTHTQSESLSHTQPPPGLQLLLRKSAPIRWELGARGANSPTSRIWKRVRYMMPPPPPSPPHTRGQRLNTIQLI